MIVGPHGQRGARENSAGPEECYSPEETSAPPGVAVRLESVTTAGPRMPNAVEPAVLADIPADRQAAGRRRDRLAAATRYLCTVCCSAVMFVMAPRFARLRVRLKAPAACVERHTPAYARGNHIRSSPPPRKPGWRYFVVMETVMETPAPVPVPSGPHSNGPGWPQVGVGVLAVAGGWPADYGPLDEVGWSSV